MISTILSFAVVILAPITGRWALRRIPYSLSRMRSPHSLPFIFHGPGFLGMRPTPRFLMVADGLVSVKQNNGRGRRG